MSLVLQRLTSIFFRIASSIPLMNFTDSSVLNVRASSSASLITTAGGVSGIAQHLADRHPQNQPVEDRHPLGPPAFGGVGDQRVDRRRAAATVSRASAEAKSRSSSAGGSASGHCRCEERLGGRGRRRRCRRPTDRESAAPPRAPDGAGPSARVPPARSSASPAASSSSCSRTIACFVPFGLLIEVIYTSRVLCTASLDQNLSTPSVESLLRRKRMVNTNSRQRSRPIRRGRRLNVVDPQELSWARSATVAPSGGSGRPSRAPRSRRGRRRSRRYGRAT